MDGWKQGGVGGDMHFLHHLLFTMFPLPTLFDKSGGVTPPASSHFLLTDNSDFLLTDDTFLNLAEGVPPSVSYFLLTDNSNFLLTDTTFLNLT